MHPSQSRMSHATSHQSRARCTTTDAYTETTLNGPTNIVCRMYIHLVEYVNSLAILGGKRWMEGASAVYLLTENDIQVVNAINLRRK